MWSFNSPSALVVAHPSHELRVYGWLERARPLVFVMTDGSGRAGQARLNPTAKTLARLGARPGPIFGRLTDLEMYAAILNRDFNLFKNLADELADSFALERIKYVVGDAAEGYNSTHDICRLLINTAIELVQRQHDEVILNFDFPVVEPPEEYRVVSNDKALWIHLDEAMFARKVATAQAYNSKLAADVEAALRGEKFQGIKRFSEPQIAGQVDVQMTQTILTGLKSHPELDAKFKDMLGGVELDAFRVECLRPVSDQHSSPASEAPPFYEIYAEKLVAAGHYQHAIRYQEHIRPIADALREHVKTGV